MAEARNMPERASHTPPVFALFCKQEGWTSEPRKRLPRHDKPPTNEIVIFLNSSRDPYLFPQCRTHFSDPGQSCRLAQRVKGTRTGADKNGIDAIRGGNMVRFLKLASCALALGLAMVACGGGSSSGSDQATGSTDDKLTIVGSSS
jgi:hypothetical protein